MRLFYDTYAGNERLTPLVRDVLRGLRLVSPEHPRGKHKARVFASALGLTAEDSEELRRALLSAASSEEATSAEEDEYGQRYVLDFELSTEVGRAVVRSGWIVRSSEDFPRFTSCWVL